MSSFFISIVIAVCVGGLVYLQALRRTGSNHQSSLIVGAVAAVAVFIVAITLIKVT